MDLAFNTILFLHVLAALGIIGLVLIQHGKGADMGAAFGGGSSGSLFGATGNANFLSRMTAVLATVFFLTSLSMAYIATHKPKAGGGAGVMENVTNVPKAPVVPAAPAGVPSPATIPGQDPAKATLPGVPAAGTPTTQNPGGDALKSNQIPK